MWTIDLWSELYLEVVSIEATKIATYFLKKSWFERGFVRTPSPYASDPHYNVAIGINNT